MKTFKERVSLMNREDDKGPGNKNMQEAIDDFFFGGLLDGPMLDSVKHILRMRINGEIVSMEAHTIRLKKILSKLDEPNLSVGDIARSLHSLPRDSQEEPREQPSSYNSKGKPNPFDKPKRKRKRKDRKLTATIGDMLKAREDD